MKPTRQEIRDALIAAARRPSWFVRIPARIGRTVMLRASGGER